MMEKIQVGLIGLGTVGTGVAKTLLQQQDLLRSRTGITIELAKVADLDITTSRDVELPEGVLTTDVGEILNNPDIQIVVELIGGYEPAKTFGLRALRNGKHLVTANKALLAVHGQEIFEAAQQHHVDIGFEASVGGGIPIIRSVREGLAANNFHKIFGILNGTTNYILTEMTDKGESYDAILRQAQEMGLAEADPSFDVEGIDAAHKIAILAYLAFGQHIQVDHILTEGISTLDLVDITFAKELGYKIKLLAITQQIDHAVEVRVHPTMLPVDHLLAKVDGSFNAVYAIGDIVGSTMFYGHGAGMMPTASAVVGDLVDIARNLAKGISNKIPLLPAREERSQYHIQAPDQFCSRYYLRFTTADRPGVLAKISGILAHHDISLASVIQKEKHPVNSVPVVLLTYEASEHAMQGAVQDIDRLDIITAPTVLIRVL